MIKKYTRIIMLIPMFISIGCGNTEVSELKQEINALRQKVNVLDSTITANQYTYHKLNQELTRGFIGLQKQFITAIDNVNEFEQKQLFINRFLIDEVKYR